MDDRSNDLPTGTQGWPVPVLLGLALVTTLAVASHRASHPDAARAETVADGTAPTAAPSPTAPAVPTEIEASHVLVMYRGSMRAPDNITRTRDEARARAEEVLRKARGGADFATLARQYSDEPGAGDRGGSLGRFGHGAMIPAFEQAAFALHVGQISDVVETPFGFHVIKRTG